MYYSIIALRLLSLTLCLYEIKIIFISCRLTTLRSVRPFMFSSPKLMSGIFFLQELYYKWTWAFISICTWSTLKISRPSYKKLCNDMYIHIYTNTTRIKSCKRAKISLTELFSIFGTYVYGTIWTCNTWCIVWQRKNVSVFKRKRRRHRQKREG